MANIKRNQVLYSPLLALNPADKGGSLPIGEVLTAFKIGLGFFMHDSDTLQDPGSIYAKARKQLGVGSKRWPAISPLTIGYSLFNFLATAVLANFSDDPMLSLIKEKFKGILDFDAFYKTVRIIMNSPDENERLSAYNKLVLDHANNTAFAPNAFFNQATKYDSLMSAIGMLTRPTSLEDQKAVIVDPKIIVPIIPDNETTNNNVLNAMVGNFEIDRGTNTNTIVSYKFM